MAQETNAAAGLEGTWEGVLGGRLQLVVTIHKTSNGDLAGLMDSTDQHATLPIEKASQDGSQVRFEVSRVGGVYQGTMTADGSEISGSWTQTGVPEQPLSFKRTAVGKASPESETKTPEHTPKPQTLPLDIVIPMAPTAFKADGKWHVAYELHVSNLGKWACDLTRVDILDANGGQKPLASFSGSELDGMVVHPGGDDAQKSKIGPAQFAVVYMWATFDNLEAVPASFRQRVTAKIGDYPEGFSIDTSATPVDRKPVVVIDAPLTGDEWVAANGPSNTSGHRRALIPVNGRAYISQRYAIDWVELYPDGKTYQGDPADNKNYRAYGHEIHAVADGIVTETKDGLPQNTPGAKSLAIPITLETIGGNHVITDMGNGLYAFYAHMQPGTLRVKVGDKVHRGQVLGLLGNTGNSSEPHLHFDICNASSMLACQGFPYAFASFEVVGKGEGWKSSDSHEAAVKHEMEIPTEDEIVQFPAAP
ncbi:MAG TPA: M23 family metallopeptidase [Candidatus Acidoferrales bacterium]